MAIAASPERTSASGRREALPDEEKSSVSYDGEMGAADDDFKLMRRTVICVCALVALSTLFDWLRIAQSETIVPGRLNVTVYAIYGTGLVEGIAVFFLGLLGIAGVLVFRHMGLKWAAVVAPLCGLAITGIAVYSAIYISTLAGDFEPDDVRVGYGLWFIVFAGPLIFGVSSMMALEVFRPKFWTKIGDPTP